MKTRWVLLGLVLVALIVPAAALTVARLLEPDGGRWVRLVSFTPLAVPLYAAAMLILLLGYAAGRGWWRGVAGWLAAAAAVALVLHVFWASGPYLGHASASASNGQPFTVMTANLKIGAADTTRLVELAVEHHADVLVLEELTPLALGGLEVAGVRQVFPFSAGKAEPGATGTMVFSTYKISGVRRLQTGLASYAMRLRLPKGSVDLLAVHPLPPNGDAVDWRRDHRTIMRAARATTRPTLIVGDFNATPDHKPMRELAGRGFTDAATQAKSGWQPTWPSSGEASFLGVPVPSLLQLDHVLMDDNLHALDTESVSIDGTDHRALLTRLALG